MACFNRVCVAIVSGHPASALADAYLAMGAKESNTTQPHVHCNALLTPTPTAGKLHLRSLPPREQARERRADRVGRVERCHVCQQYPRGQDTEIRRLSGHMRCVGGEGPRGK